MPLKNSSRQHQILAQLLENRAGLSADTLAATLGISRTAVQQHFAVLEGDGYIKKTALNKTAGRPVALYGLTDKGINYFPKQYAWLAGLLLSGLQEEMGDEAFAAYMQRLGKKLADQLSGQFVGMATEEKRRHLLGIMAGLGFQVQQSQEPDTGQTVITANNCIYHDVAQQHPALCGFDRALMSNLLEEDVRQSQCMATGDCNCRFKIG